MRARKSYIDMLPPMGDELKAQRRREQKERLNMELSDSAKGIMAKRMKLNKYMRYREAALFYCLGVSNIKRLAKESGALLHVGKCVLIDTDIFEKYLDSFRDE
jgi:hypothetical protein